MKTRSLSADNYSVIAQSNRSAIHRASVAALIALIGGALFVFVGFPLVGERPYVTDFGRDMVGAQLVESGESPYQRVTLRRADETNSVLDDQGWIAHPPAGIALGRAAESAFGLERAEYYATLVGAVAIAVLAAMLLRRLEAGPLARTALVALVFVNVATRDDLIWLQHAAVFGLGLVAAFSLSEQGRSTISGVILGVIGALKVWPVFLAMFLPGDRHRWRTVTVTGLTALFLNLALLPVAGGASALVDWLTVALPANTSEFLRLSFSIGSAVLPNPWLLGGVYLVAMVAATRIPCADLALPVAATLHFSLAPLVWPAAILLLLPAWLWRISAGEIDWWTRVACLAIPVSGSLIALGLPFGLGRVGPATMLLGAGQLVSLIAFAKLIMTTRSETLEHQLI